MRLSLQAQYNGTIINLPASHAQRTFMPGRPRKLLTLLGSDAIAYSIVTKYLRQWRFPSTLVDPLNEPPTTIFHQSIFEALEKWPLASLRELAKFACTPNAIVH
jgi:hypothetical protein